MKKLYLIFFSILFLYASNKDSFLKTLNEVSEIATKTKLNLNKTPSNVEVINRDFIIKSGARTLLDILKYLPGIEISMSASGKREIVIRGNKSTYRDKIKFLINGHEVTNNLYSNQFYYYNFPAALIKRIEFTKTPDAVLYGDKAYLGVINIITLNKFNDNQFSFYQTNKKQTTLTIFDKLNKNTLIDAHYEISNPTIKKTKTYLVDVSQNKPQPIGIVRDNRPYELEKEVGFGLRYKKENSTISYRLQYFHKGNFFGVINLPPLVHDRHVNLIHQYLNYHFSNFLTDDIIESFNTGIKHYQWKGAFRVGPIDLNFSNLNSDLIEGANIKEYEIYARNRLTYNSEKHITNFILETKYARPYKYDYFQYVVGHQKTISPLFPKNIHRYIYSIALEDLYIIKDNFSIIYGSRYSHYSDFGSNLSYKLGSVYNLNNKTTFKLLFNTAFRAPSWVELYAKTAAAFNGDPTLKAEKIKMLEFTYLQKIFSNDQFQFTIYRGKSKHYIGRDISPITHKEIYKNLGDLIIKGYEISYKKSYSKGYFGINYSYNNNKNEFNNLIAKIYYLYSRVRKRLIKGYNIYNINPNLSFFSGVIYGGKPDIPENIKHINFHYFTLNTNLNYHKNNFNVIFGIDNLTNHKNYYFVEPSDIVYGRYVFMQENSALPLTGRKIFIDLIKKW